MSRAAEVSCESVHAPVDYLNPGLPAALDTVAMPVVDATPAALRGYGYLVDDPDECRVEIVRWPAAGRRPVDADTGDQGGTTEGVFVSEWRGDILYGRNEAVGGHYILAYAELPESARTDHANDPRRMLLWHANYHPDGGQLFFPLDPRPFYVPLALPGDEVTPQHFVCFRAATAARDSTVTPTSGMKAYSASGEHSGSSIVKARCTRASPWTLPREFACLLEAPIHP